MLHALLPSALVSVACMVAAELLKLILPPMPALGTLLVMALPLALVWYLALRVCRHPMVDEVHQIVSGLRARLA
jgi:hypothetical protein